ncbi:MAG: septum formation protein Maf [Acidimicrobiales bacterium]|nr:septum formation protein Maf [Acidimicrobiales bacterium]
MRLVLASGSPRRAAILEGLGLSFEAAAASVDETRRPDEPPLQYVERLAREKASTAAAPDVIVIGCDTVVVHGGKILGKPGHPEEARSMLRRLQGDTHEVATGLAVAGFKDGGLAVESAVDVTEVTFLPMTDEEIADYVATGEPMDKAGAYALQEYGGVFVESIRGSAHTVVGMPVHLLPRLLARFDVKLNAFERAG